MSRFPCAIAEIIAEYATPLKMPYWIACNAYSRGEGYNLKLLSNPAIRNADIFDDEDALDYPMFSGINTAYADLIKQFPEKYFVRFKSGWQNEAVYEWALTQGYTISEKNELFNNHPKAIAKTICKINKDGYIDESNLSICSLPNAWMWLKENRNLWQLADSIEDTSVLCNSAAAEEILALQECNVDDMVLANTNKCIFNKYKHLISKNNIYTWISNPNIFEYTPDQRLIAQIMNL